MATKLVLSDLDGTLFRNGKGVSSRSIAAIRRIREKVILFGIATGRDALSVEGSLRKWGLSGLVDVLIASNGSEIRDYSHHLTQELHFLSADSIRKIMGNISGRSLSFVVPYNGILYASKKNFFLRLLSHFDHTPVEKVNLIDFAKEGVSKVMILGSIKAIKAAEAQAASLQSEVPLSIVKTAPVNLELYDARNSKCIAAKLLAQENGFSMAEVMAFGDGDNDAEMLKEAGVGIAMANGTELAKRSALKVTDDNNHDGVAKILEAL